MIFIDKTSSRKKYRGFKIPFDKLEIVTCLQLRP